MNNITIYGITNCDTVRKARRWLEQHNINYQFHDLRVDGITASKIKQWFKTNDWESILNKRSTTFRQLNEQQKLNLNADNAAKLIVDHPTLIKRPVLEQAQSLLIGFNEAQYQALLK